MQRETRRDGDGAEARDGRGDRRGVEGFDGLERLTNVFSNAQ